MKILYLTINNAEDRLQFILSQDGEFQAGTAFSTQGKSMQYQAPALAGLFSAKAISPADLAGIAVVRGPGSFTGLRMALALAYGMATAHNTPLAGLNYLRILAAGAISCYSLPVAVLTYSRRNQVYFQAFSPASGHGHLPVPLCLPQVLTPYEGIEQIKQLKISTLLGSGIAQNQDFFSTALPSAQYTLLPASFNHPFFSALSLAAKEGKYNHTPPDPLYLRASDAEDNLTSIATKRGLCPDKAKEDLNKAISSFHPMKS